MYNIILIEYGIVISKDETYCKSFVFMEPIKEYEFIKSGKLSMINELVEFINGEHCVVNDQALLNILQTNSVHTQMMNDDEINKIRLSKQDILVNSGIAKDLNDATSKLRDFSLRLSASRISEISQNDDLHVIHAVNSLDELDRIINSINSRMREWYGLHFPELDNIVDSTLAYAKLVTKSKKRNDITVEICENSGFPEDKILEIMNAIDKSNDGDISDEHIGFIQTLANFIVQMNDLRCNLEEHLNKQVSKIAPNMTSILGPLLTARMISHVGSIKKLARMSSSTIQIIGAEKALFRSIKTGAKPPKHGLLFQHPLIHSTDKLKRGKISRIIASKTAIASRIDAFGLGLNNELVKKLDSKIQNINEKNNMDHEIDNSKQNKPEDKSRIIVSLDREDDKPRGRFGRRSSRDREDDKPRGRFGRRSSRDREDDKPRGRFGRRSSRDREDDKPRGRFGRRSSRDREDDKPRGRFGRRSSRDREDDKPRGRFGRRSSRDREDDKPRGRFGRRSSRDREDDKPRGRFGRRSSRDREDDKPRGRFGRKSEYKIKRHR